MRTLLHAKFDFMEWLVSEFWEIKCTEDKSAFYECFAVVTKKKSLKFVMKYNDIDVWRTLRQAAFAMQFQFHESKRITLSQFFHLTVIISICGIIKLFDIKCAHDTCLLQCCSVSGVCRDIFPMSRCRRGAACTPSQTRWLLLWWRSWSAPWPCCCRWTRQSGMALGMLR